MDIKNESAMEGGSSKGMTEHMVPVRVSKALASHVIAGYKIKIHIF
jgi:hypothetical protein